MTNIMDVVVTTCIKSDGSKVKDSHCNTLGEAITLVRFINDDAAHMAILDISVSGHIVEFEELVRWAFIIEKPKLRLIAG